MPDPTTYIATFVAFAKLNYIQREAEDLVRDLAMMCG